MRSTTLSLAFLCLTAAVTGANVDASDFSITDVLPPSGSSTTSTTPSSSSDSSVPTTSSETPTSSSSTPPSTSSSSTPSTSSSISSEPSKTAASHTTTTHALTSASNSESVSESSSIMTSAPPSSSYSPIVIVTTKFVSGSSVAQTFTSSTPVPASTSPALSSGGDSGSSGLSTSAKNTIIGVVVGVGGAIVLAGLAFVAWRVWGHKRRDHDNDEDDLMSAGTAVGSNSREKAPGSANTPFKSTLDQYHNPGPVNAASNF